MGALGRGDDGRGRAAMCWPGRGRGPAAASEDPFVVRDPQFVPLDGVPLVVPTVGEYRGDIRLTAATGGLAAVNNVGPRGLPAGDQ